MQADLCPICDPAAAGGLAELVARLAREPWLLAALAALERSGLPEAWIGAGVLRDAVWGQLHRRPGPPPVRDIDVAFLDQADPSRERDASAQSALAALLDAPWEATNQAAVHTWFPARFGSAPVPQLKSIHDAVATWPETATSVAARLSAGRIEICAPHGLADLLRGHWRRNPTRVSIEESRARLARHDVGARWPLVRIHQPG
jgi:hypothetical protein